MMFSLYDVTVTGSYKIAFDLAMEAYGHTEAEFFKLEPRPAQITDSNLHASSTSDGPILQGRTTVTI